MANRPIGIHFCGRRRDLFRMLVQPEISPAGTGLELEQATVWL